MTKMVSTQFYESDTGVSPVIGIILIVAISVALVTLAATLVFNIGENVNEPITGTSVNIEQQEENDDIRVIINRNSGAERVFLRGDGVKGEQDIVDSRGGTGTASVSPSSTEGTIEVVGETENGNEQVIDTAEYDDYSGDGSGETNTESSGDDKGIKKEITGVLTVEGNPIEGVTIQVVDQNGNVISTNKTNSSGEYNITSQDAGNDRLIVDSSSNDIDYESETLYLSDGTNINTQDNIDFNFGTVETEEVNGNDVKIAYSQDTGGRRICNIYQLQGIKSEMYEDYRLVCNIDASPTQSWNGGKGFDPIGDDNFNRFGGNLSGNYYSISELYIDRPSREDVGIFGMTESYVNVTNLILRSPDVTGSEFVGPLSGDGVAMENVKVTNSVSSGKEQVGGVTGNLEYARNVTAESVDVSIGGQFSEDAGGIAGYASASDAKNLRVTGKVEGTDDEAFNIGGVVGDMGFDAEVSDVVADVQVSGNDDNVGGFAGSIDFGNIDNITVKGTVTGTDRLVGGISGSIYGTSNASNLLSEAKVVGGTGDYTGGLFGNVDDHSPSFGSKTPLIEDSVSKGNIESEGDRVGGAFGRIIDDAKVSNVTSKGNVSGSSSSFGVGGLAGDLSRNAKITSSVATGNVEGQDSVGGLVGDGLRATVKNSRSEGTVTGVNGGEGIGGLIGDSFDIQANESISNSDVVAPQSSNVGGFAGSLTIDYDTDKDIIDSIAAGDVEGENGVGGFAGQYDGGDGAIRNVIAYGSVNGNTDVGGLVGRSDGFGIESDDIIEAYWDKQATGQTTSTGGGTGLSTDDMQGDNYNPDFESNIVDRSAFDGVTGDYPRLNNVS